MVSEFCFCCFQVFQIFEKVKNRHSQGQINPAFEHDLAPPDTQTEESLGRDETSESGRETENSALSTTHEQSTDLNSNS